MAALSLSPDQADLLAEHAASEAAIDMEAGGAEYGNPVGVLASYDKLEPLVRLIRGLVERREIVEPELAKTIVLARLSDSREEVGREHEALAQVCAGNRDYFNHGKSQEESERSTEEQIEKQTKEGIALQAVLDLLNGRPSEAVAA
ncbi:MAG TPA: hypothetical protein VFW48_09270 [Solirubrobacterales bacterium]|nr:hypothetical protein [Solirubrobacterales bacterium]